MVPLLVLAQAAAPAAVAAPAPEAQGVISYPAAFFAAQQPANAEEMIERLPGFSLDSGSSVRGYEGAAGNVLIDGQRPSTKTDSLQEVLRRISAAQVERIDVIRGGAPGIDMQGKTVIANVIRKKTGGAHGVAALAIQPVLNGYRAPLSVRLEGNGDDARGRHWEASVRASGYVDDGSGDGQLVKDHGSGPPDLAGDIRSKGGGDQAILAGVYELPVFAGRLHVNGRLFWDDYRFKETDDIHTPSAFLQHDNQKQDKFDTELGGSYSRKFGPADDLDLVALRQTEHLTYNEQFDSPSDATVFSQLNDTAETIVRAVEKHRHSDTLSWEAGAEGALNTLDTHQTFTDMGQPIPLPGANVHVEEKRGEAFVKTVWRVHPKVTVEADLRQEGSNISSTGDVVLDKTLYFTKPRIALTWDMDRLTQVRLRYERVVGQLNFSDFVATSSLNTGVVTAGNPNLNPEQDWVSEATLERRFLKAGVISFTYRHSEIKDAIDRAPVFSDGSVFDAPANIGSGKKDEYIVQATVPLDSLGIKDAQLRGVGTWRHSVVTDPLTGEKREISGLHPVDWEGHFIQDVPEWRLTWGVDAFGGWRESYYRFNSIEDKKLKTFVITYAEWKPRPDTAIRVEIDNTTARGFHDFIRQWTGPRDRTPLQFAQDRDTHFGQYLFLRVRRTFD
jgi:hypothetical protein